METQRNEGSGRRHRTWIAGLMLIVLATVGCASAPQPHVTAKVIFQDESGVAAEVATEWR